MARYRKKPVVIEAIQFNGIAGGCPEFAEEIPEWLKYAIWQSKTVIPHPMFPETRLQVETTEGNMIADAGDWIIKGVEDELYPCKPSVFEATYDPAD
jgi:hypothetical protein